MRPALSRFAATLWAGALWGGALVAWQFFATLARPVAGAAVTSLFATQAWIALGCALVLLASSKSRSTRLLVLAMLSCALTIRLGLMPLMDQLKAGLAPGAPLAAGVRTWFGLLHLASTVFYALESYLAWRLVKPGTDPGYKSVTI